MSAAASQADEPLTLEWLQGRYAVCRLDADQAVPEWVNHAMSAPPQPALMKVLPPNITATFSHSQECENVSKPQQPCGGCGVVSITRSDRELSIVIDERSVPANVHAQRGFAAMRFTGILDFSIVGVLAKLTGALAAAKVPVFVISTFETDVLLVHASNAQVAADALKSVAQIAPGMAGAL